MNENLTSIEDEPVMEVDQSKWDMQTAPGIIRTYGLGPCTGIGIYNPNKREAYMGHFVDPGHEVEEVEAMVSKAVANIIDIKDFKVYLAGCAPCEDGQEDIDEAIKGAKEKRDFMIKILENHGFKKDQITKEFQDNPDSSTEISIDASTGKFECEVDCLGESYECNVYNSQGD